MKINVRAPLNTYDGSPVWLVPPQINKENGEIVREGEPMHLYDVLIQVSLQPSASQKPYSQREQIIRFALGYDTWKAKENGSGVINISRKVLEVVQDDICRIYAPIVGGQVLTMMGYTLEDLAELFGDDMVDELRSMIGGSPKAS